MARNITIADLITRAKYRADMENSEFVSDAEWKNYLSVAYGELFEELVDSGMRYFESEVTVTSVAGTGSYSLPTNHFSTIGVDYCFQGGRRRQLKRFMPQERNLYSGSNAGEFALAYALVGSNLVLYPTPSRVQDYKHVYIQTPTDITTSADSSQIDVWGPSGEQFVVWSAACLALSKEDGLAPFHMQEREAARARVKEKSAERAFVDPQRRITDGELEIDQYDEEGRYFGGAY